LYFDLARALATEGVNSVRVDYRRPGDLVTCVLDVAVAVDLAQRCGGKRFVVMGHSFGGAVAIGAAASLPDLVTGVVTLAGQSAAANRPPNSAGSRSCCCTARTTRSSRSPRPRRCGRSPGTGR